MSPGELHQAVGSRGHFTSLWLWTEENPLQKIMRWTTFKSSSARSNSAYLIRDNANIYINNQVSRNSKYCINFLPFNAFWIWKFFIKIFSQKIPILLDIRLLTHLINLCEKRKYHCIFKMMSTYDIWEYC